MFTCNIQSITNEKRLPTLQATIYDEKNVVLQATATKYKEHPEFGKMCTVIENLSPNTPTWEELRLLIKKLQANCRSEFPGTAIFVRAFTLSKFHKEFIASGAKTVNESTYDVSIISPLF